MVSLMRRSVAWPLALAICLSSCAKTGKIEQGKQINPIGPGGTPIIRSANSDAGTPVTPGGNAPVAPTAAAFTPEEDIVFTDPDHPDSTLPELSTILTAPTRRGPWEESETIAKQRSAREGKPLLIWFTDSARSPMCKALSDELFSTPDFETWASDRLVRLRVDSNSNVKDPNLSMDEQDTRRADVRDYVARLKKQYKILGYPSLVLLNPSGEVVGKYRGYKRGDADFTWGQLKQGEAVSSEAYKGWRTGLEKKGYREWSDRRNRKVFAKLTGYSKGTLTLIEPDGTRSRTEESKLSDKDQAWIDEQKKLRGLQ